MTLSSMVVSRDWQEASVLERILGALHMDVAVERGPQQALARFRKEKIDALIVDCDLEGSAQLLHQLRRAERRAPAAPLVILRGPRSHNLRQSAALCALEKPVSVEEAVHALSAARNVILDGRLRYHRAGLDVPVSLNCRNHKREEAHLVNLSQGGMRIHTEDPVEASKLLRVSFVLPGARPVLRAQAEIAWRDQRGNLGIRFVKIAPRQQRMLRQWLARQYFAN
jgi:CheY-like chemotaxis protein